MNQPPRRARSSARSLLAAVLTTPLLINVPAFGAETAAPRDSDDSQTLAPVVVTATRTETPADRTGASVTLWEASTLDAAGLGSVGDVLRLTPGMHFAAPGPDGLTPRVFTRGTPTRHTLFLLDGRRLPVNLAGAFDPTVLGLDGLERIEVVRGPLSAVTGGNAMGGVVNLISNRAEPGETRASLRGELGSFETRALRLAAQAADDRLDATVSAGWFETANDRPNNDVERATFGTHFGVTATERVYADVRFDYSRRKGGAPNTTVVDDRTARLDTEFYQVSPGLRLELGERWTHALFFSYGRQEYAPRGFLEDFPLPPGRSFGANGVTTVQTREADYQADFAATDDWRLTFGGSFQQTRAERFNDGTSTVGGVPGVDVRQRDESAAVFAQSQWSPVDWLDLIQAVRHDDTDNHGGRTTWRAAAAGRVPATGTRWHAGYSTAFSPPTAQDLAPVFFGNPALSPEKARGWEVGLAQPLAGGRATVSATWFRNRIDDLIVFDLGTFTLENVGRNTNEGVELGLRLVPWEQLAFEVQHTWLDARDDTAGTRLTGRARHVTQAAVTWRPVEAVTAVWTARHVSGVNDFAPGAFAATPQPSYQHHRLAVTWAVSERASVFGRVENLFNSGYEEVPGYPANPRGYYAGATLSF